MRYNYNRQLSPPAPFVHVTLAAPGDSNAVDDVPAQLDTAADRSVIPWAIVDALALPQLDELPALGFGGHLTSAATFLLDIAIRTFNPVTVEVFGSREEPFVLLGRDVLNHYRLVLDGPSLIVEIDGHRK
jgi:hypothetical protein